MVPEGCFWSGGRGFLLLVPGGVSQHAMGQTPSPVNRLTDRCKNITFATLLRTVKIGSVPFYGCAHGNVGGTCHTSCTRLGIGNNGFLLWYVLFTLHRDREPLLPSATKLRQGYVFTRVCDSVKRGRLPHCMLGYTPLSDQKQTPPGPKADNHPRDQKQTPPGRRLLLRTVCTQSLILSCHCLSTLSTTINVRWVRKAPCLHLTKSTESVDVTSVLGRRCT